MASSQDNSLYSIKKLDGTNFPLWKKEILHVLVQKKQLKPIKLKGIKPEDMDEDKWNEMDELALSTIMLTLAKSVYFNVVDEVSTYDAWTKLSGLYEKQSAASKVYWLKKLVDLKMNEGTPMSNHLNEFNTIYSQLSAQGVRLVTRRNTKNLEIPEVPNNIEYSRMPDIVLREYFGRDKDLKNLLKTVQPEPFTREDSHNASKLEEWIISMEDYFDLAEYNFVAKGIMGKAKIKGPAKIWNCKSTDVVEIILSWEELQLCLRERYSPPNYLTTKMNEFFICVRRGRTIDTYYEDFIKLFMHAPLITEEQKISRFILGLEGKLADEVKALKPTSLADALIWDKPKFSSFLKSNNQ
ncbi:hypothetical protein L7F22_021033 [Adiantum nelumboides]|nr:hypothetical protein [Adiantum nelumboides]